MCSPLRPHDAGVGQLDFQLRAYRTKIDERHRDETRGRGHGGRDGDSAATCSGPWDATS